MIEQNMDRLVYLDIPGEEAAYAQKEGNLERLPFEMERIILRFITEGKPKEMIKFSRNILLQRPGLKVPIGKTSRVRLRQLKYSAISGIALACRAAIVGGASEIECYAKSDAVIMMIDEMTSEYYILQKQAQTFIEYATMVQKTHGSYHHPHIVKECIQYILSHIHENISLEQLAQGSGYTKEYIAKLFKKHVGMSISDYIQKMRINEAKELLTSGKSCSETACILNYTSQSYFIRQFKKQTGLTPKNYIRLNR